MTELSWRLTTDDDLPGLRALMARAIAELQTAFLSPEEIAASRHIMGLDTQLIADRTYFAVFCEDILAGCGGWSRRATLYGADHSPGRDAALLDPKTEPARLRAMYSHPDFARRGIGRLIVALAEEAAARAGFRTLRLGSTLAGQPLYHACGFREVERAAVPTPSGVAVPIITMEKVIDAEAAARVIARSEAR